MGGGSFYSVGDRPARWENKPSLRDHLFPGTQGRFETWSLPCKGRSALKETTSEHPVDGQDRTATVEESPQGAVVQQIHATGARVPASRSEAVPHERPSLMTI